MTSAIIVTSDLYLCPTNLDIIVRRCIPKEMIPSGWKSSNLSVISNVGLLRAMGKSTLGMFRSTEELFTLIVDYLGIPGCANLVDFDLNGLYATIPRIHKSLKGVDFVYKIDLLALATIVTYCPFTNWQQKMVLSAMKACQRFLESKWKSEFQSHCEMVQPPTGYLKYLSERLGALSENYSTKAESLMKSFGPCSAVLQPHDLNVYWTDMLKLDAEGASVVYKILRKYNERYPITENKDDYIKMLSWIGVVARMLADFMTNSIPSTNSKATVRLFSAGKDNFVMAHELLQSLRNKNFNVSGFEEEVLGMPKLSTLEFREVARKVNIQDMKNIEFIRITQPETKLHATPIPSPNGDYCVRAIDTFHELLNDMIVAKKVFQTIDKDQFQHIEDFFDSVKEHFCSNQGVYFISLEDLNLIKSMWETCYESKLKNSKEANTTRKVRNVRNRDSEMDELKKVYLNLETCFPNMKTIAGGEYLKKKPTDMYATIFQWQVTALRDEITYIEDFLHSQKVCSEWIPHSPCCGEGAEIMEMIKTAYAAFQAEEDAKEAAEAEIKNKEVAAEVPEKKKRSKKVKKTKEPRPELPLPTSGPTSITSEFSSDPEPEIPEAKESQACPKCSRASHFANVANEKLRLSKVECKHLKKDLANAELEVEVLKQKVADKEERIRMLEELLKSKDDIIERQNTDLLEKQNVIMSFEMEMESRDNTLQEKSTTIKDLEKSLKMKDYRINELEAQQSSELRTMAPTRSDEETEKVRDVLFKLLEIQGTLRSGNPIGKCRELAQRICMKAHNKEIEDATRIEAIRFCNETKTYIQAVTTQLEMIRGCRVVKPEEIPELPNFPALSQRFMKAYENIFKSEAPKICHSLLKTLDVKPGELADTDCLICIEEMDSEEGTIKCDCCKRRYHLECAQEWFKTKRTCPACSLPLLDDSEFLSLA